MKKTTLPNTDIAWATSEQLMAELQKRCRVMVCAFVLHAESDDAKIHLKGGRLKLTGLAEFIHRSMDQLIAADRRRRRTTEGKS